MIFGLSLAYPSPKAKSPPEEPRGIFVLSQKGVSVTRAPLPDFVAGYSLRISWKDLETGPDTYDFSVIRDTVSHLQKRGKRLTLEVLSLFAPDHVIAGAGGTFPVKMGRESSQTPLPWDGPGLARWEKLFKALAREEILDSTTGLTMPFSDHPTLVCVDAPILGLQGLRDMQGTLTRREDYDRERFISSLVHSVRISRDAFPKKYGFMGFFRMDDGKDRARPLDQVVFERLKEEFMGPGGATLGLFQELWSDQGPRPDGLGFYLAKLEAPNVVILQALTAWSRPFTNPNAVKSGDPDQAFEDATRYFNGRYFEMYEPDISNPKLEPTLRKWALKLMAPR